MRKSVSIYFFVTTVIFQVNILGQQPFNKDLYKPIPLQQFTPPKDTTYKENKLIVFNMLEKKFDTVLYRNNDHHLNKKHPTYNYEQHNGMIYNLKGQEYVFSNLLPADQLAEFPDYPISTTVKLFLTFFNPNNHQGGFGTCSGVIISPGYILTAGHCVKSNFDSSYVVSCTVVPAYNLGSTPFGITTTTNWYSFTQWTANGNLDYDMAIMSLTNPIGNNTKWLDWGYNSNDSFFTSASNVFYSFGYPGYDPIGNPAFEEGERMYYMRGNMDFWNSSNTMCHNNIAYQGLSGSGLYYQDSSNNRKVYGVLSHGSISPPYYTCHCRMDSSMFELFNSIIPEISSVENERIKKQILIYPNPTKGIFKIDFSEIKYKEIKLQIYDALGLEVAKEKLTSIKSIATIDLTVYPIGTYFIKAEIDRQIVHGRICKLE
ncbi:MAG: T9SS type A sorting domain-containing protein [Saprospiraceae bacterium]